MRKLYLGNGNSEFKFADTATEIQLSAFDDGVLASLTANAKVRVKNDSGYLLEVSANVNKNKAVITSGQLNKLPVGSYLIELWDTTVSGDTVIYPSDGFLRLQINENTTGISGGIISSITVDDFAKQFSELSQQLKRQVSDGVNEIKGGKAGHLTFVPLDNFDAIKAQYPNGADGLFLASDTGHLWVFVNGNWKDCGQFQIAAGVDETLKLKGVPADAKAVGDAIKDVYSLKDGTEIPADSDLDNYAKVGNYYVASNNNALTIANCPSVKGGLLKVYNPEGASRNFLIQHYLAFEGTRFREYKRWCDSTLRNWSDWVTTSGNVDENFLLSGGTEIPADSDLNTYKKVGNYYVISDNIANSIVNIPTHSSGLLKVYIPNGATNSINLAQHYISSNSKHLNEYKRVYFNKSWSNWIKVAGVNENCMKATNKLTVMSYNVQWFSGRNANTIMQDAIIRKFNPDIIGLQEFREYTPAAIDVSVTSGMDVWSTIFKDYEYTHIAKFGNTNLKGNASKLEMFDLVDKAFDVWHGETRGYTKCYIMVNGKKICWINTHLATTDLQADKIAQANQIVNLVKDEPYFIVTGDFNTRHEPKLGEFNSIMKPFLDIGANTANFKAADNYIFTYCDGRDFSSGNKYPHDHVITSANISIDKVFADDTKYMNMFMDTNSLDHVPLVAFLTVN